VSAIFDIKSAIAIKFSVVESAPVKFSFLAMVCPCEFATNCELKPTFLKEKNAVL
jgi:alkyl hydroperoxide reductase subunit AhpC